MYIYIYISLICKVRESGTGFKETLVITASFRIMLEGKRRCMILR